MNETYLDLLTKFAQFYFDFTFKGRVTVNTLFDPYKITYSVIVTLFYNGIKVECESEPLEHLSITKDIITEFDEMIDNIKESYKKEIFSKVDIML